MEKMFNLNHQKAKLFRLNIPLNNFIIALSNYITPKIKIKNEDLSSIYFFCSSFKTKS
jgi:hypothetical protein